ncbi:MAG: hypothetical protein LBQ97_02470 [Fusobacteriaceae bacterium]|nr:hypothetical protein [Fusobacteriaceae bacterium]
MTARWIVLPFMILAACVSFSEKAKKTGYRITPHELYKIIHACGEEFRAANGDAYDFRELVMGTAAVETDFGQYKDNRLGITQITPTGLGFIKHKADDKDRELVRNYGLELARVTTQDLEWDHAATIILTFIFYKHRAQQFPKAYPGHAAIWKKFYNTSAGKGQPRHFTEKYKRWIQPLEAAHESKT